MQKKQGKHTQITEKSAVYRSKYAVLKPLIQHLLRRFCATYLPFHTVFLLIYARGRFLMRTVAHGERLLCSRMLIRAAMRSLRPVFVSVFVIYPVNFCQFITIREKPCLTITTAIPNTTATVTISIITRPTEKN